MKAIETRWKGYRFRSRTEARWAVFFTALGIKWDYEDEGYELSGSKFYLPDFHLPKFEKGMFVEVKGEFTTEEKDLCRQLCYESGKSVLLAEGAPDFRLYVYLTKNDKEDNVDWWVGLPNADKAEGQNRMMAEPGYGDMMTYKIAESQYIHLGEKYIKAVKKAKSARFEHGEKP